MELIGPKLRQRGTVLHGPGVDQPLTVSLWHDELKSESTKTKPTSKSGPQVKISNENKYI